MNNPELIIDLNIYKQSYRKYLHNGLSVIPGKYQSKLPSIKSWSDYCYKLPTIDEAESWSRNFSETNLDLCMGEASQLVALDIDTVDEELIKLILSLAPPSPVAKIGSKGLTLFYRYNGEATQTIKFKGEMLVELLSSGKKTTIPPSMHPNGTNYKWRDKSILDIEVKDLPKISPYFFSTLEQKLRAIYGDFEGSLSKGFTTGRNSELVKVCGTLIQEKKPVDMAIQELIDFDLKNNDPHYFTDPEESNHTEPYTNALKLYTSILGSVNSKHYRKKEEYEIPITKSAIDNEVTKDVLLGKKQKQGKRRKSNIELPPAQGVIKTLQSNILNNSWVKQKDFAFSASLVLMSTLISRKVVFQGMSPNLYVLNIAPSGSGKDAPQSQLKKYLIDIGAQHLLGAGDYVSDASLMDGLESKPVRLDIMDEAGGILKSINSGSSDFGGKMADILAELYTSSNSKYLGRALAEGTKGSCFRPNVNILASTTPTGFTEGISIKAIEKGLMGRFLIFQGDGQTPAERLKSFPQLDLKTRDHLRWWNCYKPEESKDISIAGIEQMVTELEASELAHGRLDKIFGEFDLLRRESASNDPLLPIIARLYQQMIKLTIIHACSRVTNAIPEINVDDVEFGYLTIKYYYSNIKVIVDKYIFNNRQEQMNMQVLNVIRESGSITSRKLAATFRKFTKRQRTEILDDLVDSGDIVADFVNTNGKNERIYIGV